MNIYKTVLTLLTVIVLVFIAVIFQAHIIVVPISFACGVFYCILLDVYDERN